MSANDHQVGGSHYRARDLQPWDAIVAWGCGFLDGNVIKYVVRFRQKGGLQDLQKARHYLEKMIELEEEKVAAERRVMEPAVPPAIPTLPEVDE